MHIFQDPSDATDTGEKFEALLSEFSGSGDPWSAHMLAEFSCFWMALGTLCPEQERCRLRDERANGDMHDAAIAQMLRIPQQYVPQLCDDRFDGLIAKLLADGHLKRDGG